MSTGAFLIVKLAAAGDVLLATSLTRALRRWHPESAIAWLATPYAAPLLAVNPDVDEILTVPAAATQAWGLQLRQWRRRHPGAVVLLAHRSARLAWWLRALGFRRVVGFDNGWNGGLAAVAPFGLERHRLERLGDLLRAAGVEVDAPLAPRLELTPRERAIGERLWNGARRPRWVMAPGGARNPWSEMPNRRWPRERFLALGRRAVANGAAVRWLGGPEDGDDLAWIASRLRGPAAVCAVGLAPRLSAALIAASDLVIGNDSLPLVMAQALGRPGLGVYGPTAGARIHAPGQAFVQGQVGCGPCYDPRAGRHGLAYYCPRARCMEAIPVEAVWREAAHA